MPEPTNIYIYILNVCFDQSDLTQYQRRKFQKNYKIKEKPTIGMVLWSFCMCVATNNAPHVLDECVRLGPSQSFRMLCVCAQQTSWTHTHTPNQATQSIEVLNKIVYCVFEYIIAAHLYFALCIWKYRYESDDDDGDGDNGDIVADIDWTPCNHVQFATTEVASTATETNEPNHQQTNKCGLQLAKW